MKKLSLFSTPNTDMVHLQKHEEKTVFQIITITLRQGIQRAGAVRLEIGTESHTIDLPEASSAEEAANALYESLRRKLDLYYVVSSPSFAFKGDYQSNGKDVHSGEFICGGRPSMYPFKHLTSSTDYLTSDNARFRRPMLHDLQDMTVSSLPTTQLFNGRRVVYNNEICTFRQTDARNYVGSWVNPQGVVRATVS